VITLENEVLCVQLYDRPGVVVCTHKPTGMRVAGDSANGCLAVNGRRAPWGEWQIATRVDAAGLQAGYQLRHADLRVSLTMVFALEENALVIRLTEIEEHGEPVDTLEWIDLPLVTADDPHAAYWRETWRQTDWGAPVGKGLYTRDQEKLRVTDAIPDRGPQPTVHACIFQAGLCCFVHSNYPYLPLLTRVGEQAALPNRGSWFSLGLNRYQYLVRDKRAAALEARVVFLAAGNQDGQADERDYHLWLNRKFPKPDQRYATCLWGKIDCATAGAVLTTFPQALELTAAIHHVTDGIPQIVYLVGWQYDGHDTGYPALDRLNLALGGREALEDLVRVAREKYDCAVSYHINLDDSYREHPGWDERIICRHPDGSLVSWEAFNGRMSYHICHTKDVESGAVFKRLEAFLSLVPPIDTIHLDAFRASNCSWEADGFIGVMEELLCGVQPILSFFRERGIDVTTESVDRVPIEPAGLFSAVWHMDHPQIYHGKLLGGGRGSGTYAFGLGAATDLDICFAQLDDSWASIVDQIYLGALLYQLYLTREMVSLQWSDNSTRAAIRFGADLIAHLDLAEDRLRVELGEVLVAEDEHRFIPLNGAIYAYSASGCERWWRLPDDWAGIPVRLFTLTKTGRAEPPPYEVEHHRIWLCLAPHRPVKIVRAVDAPVMSPPEE
jgi:hypothetical protein